MNKLTKLLSVFLIVCTLGAGATLVSGCHKHKFSGEWSTDETSHWHQAICKHRDLKNDEGTHEFGDDLVCDTCGYDRAVHISEITLNVKSITLAVGDTHQLRANVTPANNSFEVEWSSNNSSVVSVSNSGIITALKEGSAIITAAADGKKAECLVTVDDSKAIKVKFYLNGRGTAISDIAIDDEGRVEKPEDPVDAEGLYDFAGWYYNVECSGDPVDFNTAIFERTTTLYARWTTNHIFVESIELNVKEQTVKVGREYTLSVIFKPENATNTEVEWQAVGSAATIVYTDTVNGVRQATVRGVHDGQTQITVRTKYGSVKYDASCTITVEADPYAVTGVSLDVRSQALTLGDTLQLHHTIAPSNAKNQDVSWSSDNDTVATVDANGKVTAKRAGTATITVTAEDGGFTAHCTVTVYDPASLPIKMTELAFKTAVNATINATNFTAYKGNNVVRADDNSGVIYDGGEYLSYNASNKTAVRYSPLGSMGIYVKQNEKNTFNSFGACVKSVYGLGDRLGKALEYTDYSKVEFNNKKNEYSFGGCVIAIEGGKVKRFSDDNGDDWEFVSYGDASVTLPYFMYVYEDPKIALSAVNNLDKKLDVGGNSYGLYAEKKDNDDFVTATQKGYVQTINSGVDRSVYVSFAMLKGTIFGYFELSASAITSDWDILSIVSGNSKVFGLNVADSKGTLKYKLNGAVSNGITAAELQPNKAVRIRFTLACDNVGNYKLMLQVNDKVFVDDLNLGVNTVDNITLTSSNNGQNTLTVDHVVVCGEEMTLADARTKALSRLYNLNDALVGTSGTHKRNKDAIGEYYTAAVQAIMSSENLTQITDALNAFIKNTVFDSDAEIDAKVNEVTPKINKLKADNADKYTLSSNKAQFDRVFELALEDLSAATSVQGVEDYYTRFADNLDSRLAEIPTDDEVNDNPVLSELEQAKNIIKGMLRESWADYLSANADVNSLADEYKDAIEALWTTAYNAVNAATDKKAVTDAWSTFNVSKGKEVAKAQLTEYVNTLIADANLDATADAELITAINTELDNRKQAFEQSSSSVSVTDVDNGKNAIDSLVFAQAPAKFKAAAAASISRYFNNAKTQVSDYASQKGVADDAAIIAELNSFNANTIAADKAGEINSKTALTEVKNLIEEARNEIDGLVNAITAKIDAVELAKAKSELRNLLGNSWDEYLAASEDVSALASEYLQTVNNLWVTADAIANGATKAEDVKYAEQAFSLGKEKAVTEYGIIKYFEDERDDVIFQAEFNKVENIQDEQKKQEILNAIEDLKNSTIVEEKLAELEKITDAKRARDFLYDVKEEIYETTSAIKKSIKDAVGATK